MVGNLCHQSDIAIAPERLICVTLAEPPTLPAASPPPTGGRCFGMREGIP